MADTGAPWNIPYVEATDIPRTYPTDSEALANAVAAGLSAAGNAGIGSNVVSATTTTAFTTTSTTFVDVTNLTATITPSSATSKVLVSVTLYGGMGADTNVGLAVLLRGAGIIGASTDATVNNASHVFTSNSSGRIATPGAFTVLDSPASASAVTYKVQVKVTGGTLYLGRWALSAEQGAVSSITAIEVAA